MPMNINGQNSLFALVITGFPLQKEELDALFVIAGWFGKSTRGLTEVFFPYLLTTNKKGDGLAIAFFYNFFA
ncbi:hypothetical protein [Alteromonas gracilis]|uniref:hypothetical protein n=1 Tax=Alteromonas gracilis TaxID=1479524 RepID=UPI0030D25097